MAQWNMIAWFSAFQCKNITEKLYGIEFVYSIWKIFLKLRDFLMLYIINSISSGWLDGPNHDG